MVRIYLCNTSSKYLKKGGPEKAIIMLFKCYRHFIFYTFDFVIFKKMLFTTNAIDFRNIWSVFEHQVALTVARWEEGLANVFLDVYKPRLESVPPNIDLQ